jgi:response regulator RpfG family c-di-GMP phosphodiesterase
MTERVLCVDDDPKVLQGFLRQVGDQFDMETASGGEEGLAVLAGKGPFAVVVSDMRMPGMDGVQFLARVKEQSPDTVRIMLTGDADLSSAIEAVNRGAVFRFLTKPCEPDAFKLAIRSGLEYRCLMNAERTLLRDTLTGTMKLLTDVVSMVNPAAFGRASRIRRYVKHIAVQMQLPDVWQFELAASLSQIGCVTLPRQVLDKLYAQEPLLPDEQKMYTGHPEVGRRLLENIPRLQAIAAMVERQQDPYWRYGAQDGNETDDRTALGSQILRVAIELDQLLMRGVAFDAAWHKLRAKKGEFNPEVLESLMDLRVGDGAKAVRMLSVADVQAGMIADQDIQASDGSILVPRNQEITYSVLLLLRAAARRQGVVEPFAVRLDRFVEADQSSSDSGRMSGSAGPSSAPACSMRKSAGIEPDSQSVESTSSITT